MSTYARATFNAKNYSAARPTFPKQLFDLVFQYHEYGTLQQPSSGSQLGRSRWDTAVDLGCGTGQSTVELHPFKRVVGVDPSATMLDRARQYVSSELGDISKQNQIEFVQSAAEDLRFLKDGSVDLLFSSQAAHWLDWTRVWPEIARILRQGGTAAIWCYAQMRLPQYPNLQPMVHAYMDSDSSEPGTGIGSYWEQPGRRILDNHLQDIPDASKVVPERFSKERRVYFTGDYHSSLPNPQPIILRRTMTSDNFEAYLRSFSALHTFQQSHPDDAMNPEGDITKRFLQRLRKGIEGEGGNPEEIVVEWPVTGILAKRS